MTQFPARRAAGFQQRNGARISRARPGARIIGAALAAGSSALVLWWAGPALAQAPVPPAVPPAVERRFDAADLDRSRTLTIEEAVKGGYSTETFREVDRDRDRIVTLYEIGTYLADRAKVWERADTDRDGQISRSEAEAAPEIKEVFRSADSDADGVLRKQEQEVWAQTMLYQNVEMPVVVPNLFNKKF
ncbi:MAG: EF-hand domain-containing protein [Candidatus Binatia bacterium]